MKDKFTLLLAVAVIAVTFLSCDGTDQEAQAVPSCQGQSVNYYADGYGNTCAYYLDDVVRYGLTHDRGYWYVAYADDLDGSQQWFAY